MVLFMPCKLLQLNTYSGSSISLRKMLFKTVGQHTGHLYTKSKRAVMRAIRILVSATPQINKLIRYISLQQNSHADVGFLKQYRIQQIHSRRCHLELHQQQHLQPQVSMDRLASGSVKNVIRICLHKVPWKINLGQPSKLYWI